MFDAVPVRVWLYIGLAAVAFAPAKYLIDYLKFHQSRKDLFRPALKNGHFSQLLLGQSIVALVCIVVLAIFIATPTAERFAGSPEFLPLLMAAIGSWMLWTVVKGHVSGAIEPMTKGRSWTFRRATEPKRFWASMAWNALLGGMMFFFAYQIICEEAKQPLRDRCWDKDSMFLPQETLAACDKLIADREDAERPQWIALRGSAYYELGEFDRALADYRIASRLNPDDPSSQYNMGLVFEQKRDWRKAADAYARAVKLDPGNAAEAKDRRSTMLHELLQEQH